MAHPRAPDRPRHRLRARRRAVRPRRERRHALVQTYDAGVTVDQWATLLPVSARRRRAAHSVFEDCAHWWALAHHCLARSNAIHAAAARPPRHQGRQRLHPGRSRRTSIRTRPGAMLYPMLRAARADRLRVLAGLGREARHARCRSAGRRNTTTSRRACCRRSRRAAAAICGRRASSTGAATSTASPRC